MQATSLTGPERPPASGNAPKQLMVFLHGVGSNGADLIELAPLLSDLFPDTHFLSPDGVEPCDMGPFGRQWFSLLDRDPEALYAEAQRVEAIVNSYLDAQLARFGLEPEQLALIGFSQGTMMALHCALRRADACAAVVGFSGALLGPENLPVDLCSRPPVCLVHGTADDVVPFEAMERAEAALRANGVSVEAHASIGLAHSIDPEGLEHAAHFLARQLLGYTE